MAEFVTEPTKEKSTLDNPLPPTTSATSPPEIK